MIRLNTTLNRNIFLEMFPPFAVSIFFFTFILLTRRILEVTNMVVNYQAGISSISLLLLFSLPHFLTFATPMSIMMAVLLTFLRMSSDNEVTALKSCGVSPHRFLVPVALFCLLGWIATAFVTSWLMPRANLAFRDMAADLAQSHIDAVIKERTFIDGFDGVMLYVSQVDLKRKELVDVFIQDQRNPELNNIIVAPRGQITSDPASYKIRFKLFDGVINRVDLSSQTANAVHFETYAINLDAKKLRTRTTAKSKNRNQMTLSELRAYLESAKDKNTDYNKMLMEYHEKMAMPAACLALGLMALPLGLQSRTDKRSMGIVMGIILFLVYYLVLSVGYSLGESGTLPPVVGMWLPNVIMTVTGIYLYMRAVKDLPMLPEAVPAFLNRCHPFKKEGQCKIN